MRRRALLLGALLATAALADEVASNTCLGNLLPGDGCLTDDGASGTCVEQTFTNTELICVASVSGAERRALPWIGAGLAFLALCVGIATHKPPVQSAA